MAQIIGTPRNDNLVGTSVTNSPTGADDIFGLAGDDRIDARSGNDRVFGGPGADQLLGNLGDDLLFGEDDDDFLRGGPGADQLFGGNGSDVLLGDNGADRLAGDGGDDDLLGGAGGDLLQGGDGDDNLFGDAGDDVLDGGPGDNRLSGDAGADRFILADFDVDEILDLNLADGDVVDFSALAEEALGAGLSLGAAVRLDPGPFGTTLSVDVGDGNGFQDVALLRGVEPVVQVTSPGELLALAPPAAVPLVSLSLAALDGTNGFRLEGIDILDYSGWSVSGAGDVNGDGFSDLIVGANQRHYSDAGESYVVFGDPGGFGGALDLADLDGTNGFRLDGVDRYDGSGHSVSGAGDVNGDGLADVIVGTYLADPGESYVVFGDPSGFGGVLDLAALDGTNGFRLDGVDPRDASGRSVSGAGDVNGDGFADLIVGAFAATPGGRNVAGASYVVFGDPGGFGGALDLAALDGTNGFRLDGIDRYDGSGYSVSGAGDVNGDGLADLIVGALRPHPEERPSRVYTDESYVVFGDPGGFGGALDLAALDGTNGFRLEGNLHDYSGFSVSGAGDVNGDGFADLIVGVPDYGHAVQSYVVFGDPDGFDGVLDRTALDGTNGFRLQGTGSFDDLSCSVSGAGDVNGDGFDDLIVGDNGAETEYNSRTGESYVVFGGNFTGAVDGLGGEGDDIFIGSRAGEIFVGAQGDDSLIGNGGSDLLNGAAGDDLLAIGDIGFRQLAGGSGADTVRLDGAGDALDLTAISDLFVQDVERLDLNGSGNRLVLDTREILNIDDNSNTLAVFGDDTNAVGGDLPGAAQGSATIGGVDFATFTVGQAQLLVQTGVDTSAIETAAV